MTNYGFNPFSARPVYFFDEHASAVRWYSKRGRSHVTQQLSNNMTYKRKGSDIRLRNSARSEVLHVDGAAADHFVERLEAAGARKV